MKALVVEPGKKPVIREIGTTLQDEQKVVGGLIEVVYPFRDEVALVCNEEGKYLGLEPNRALRDDTGRIYDIVCGTFFVCGLSLEDGDFSSLSDDLIERYTEKFKYPEAFIDFGDHLTVVAMVPMEEE